MLVDDGKDIPITVAGYNSWVAFINRLDNLAAGEGMPYKDVLATYSQQELYRKGFEAGVKYFITKEVGDD